MTPKELQDTIHDLWRHAETLDLDPPTAAATLGMAAAELCALIGYDWDHLAAILADHVAQVRACADQAERPKPVHKEVIH